MAHPLRMGQREPIWLCRRSRLLRVREFSLRALEQAEFPPRQLSRNGCCQSASRGLLRPHRSDATRTVTRGSARCRHRLPLAPYLSITEFDGSHQQYGNGVHQSIDQSPSSADHAHNLGSILIRSPKTSTSGSSTPPRGQSSPKPAGEVAKPAGRSPGVAGTERPQRTCRSRPPCSHLVGSRQPARATGTWDHVAQSWAWSRWSDREDPGCPGSCLRSPS